MSLAYFPMYPDDFEADTAHLTLAEDGAYNRLLRLCWRTPGCSLPADRAWIHRRMRALTDEDKAVADAILDEFFALREGRYSNARLSKEWLAAKEAHERRVNAGAKGGRAKSLKSHTPASSNAEAMPKQPEPEPEPLEAKESGDSLVTRARTRKPELPIPENWTPSDRNLSDARDRHFSDEEIRHEAAQFRDHHLARGTLLRDWDAAWRTWLGNARKFAPRVVAGRAISGGRGQGSSLASVVARRRLEGGV